MMRVQKIQHNITKTYICLNCNKDQTRKEGNYLNGQDMGGRK